MNRILISGLGAIALSTLSPAFAGDMPVTHSLLAACTRPGMTKLAMGEPGLLETPWKVEYSTSTGYAIQKPGLLTQGAVVTGMIVNLQQQLQSDGTVKLSGFVTCNALQDPKAQEKIYSENQAPAVIGITRARVDAVVTPGKPFQLQRDGFKLDLAIDAKI